MKRIIALLLALFFCASLGGCRKVICSIEGCNNEAVEDASFEEPYCSKHLADKKAFEVSKIAYENITAAYDIVYEFASDLTDVWWAVVYDRNKLIDTNTLNALLSESSYLDENSLKLGIAYVMAKNMDRKNWDELSDREKDEYIIAAGEFDGDGFSLFENCMNFSLHSIRNAYKLNGRVEEAQGYLEVAKRQMQELSGKYNDYEHYPALKGYYTMAGAYLDACLEARQSFEGFSDVRTQYEKEARDYINDLDFVFGN